MKLNKIDSLARYRSIVESYRTPEGKNNDYLQRDVESLIATGCFYEYCEGANAYLFVNKPIGHRLYFYINDFTLVPNFQNINNIVIEIIYRGDEFYPFREIEFLEKAGFKINLIRDQYWGIYKELVKPKLLGTTVKVSYASNLSEIKIACELFNNSFDVLSGNYIVEDDYDMLLKNNAILIARGEDYEFLGALHQSFIGKVASISHVAVVSKARGKYVGQSLLDTFIENNRDKGRYMLWVQRQNQIAVNMYQNKGLKYAVKSTISLIK